MGWRVGLINVQRLQSREMPKFGTSEEESSRSAMVMRGGREDKTPGGKEFSQEGGTKEPTVWTDSDSHYCSHRLADTAQATGSAYCLHCQSAALSAVQAAQLPTEPLRDV